MKLVAFAVVTAGALVTVSVNASVVLPSALLAVIVIGYVAPLPAAGVPASVAVPSPLSRNVTPAGKVPDSDSAAVGDPEAVTVNEPALPAANIADAALVIAGALSTANDCCICAAGW